MRDRGIVEVPAEHPGMWDRGLVFPTIGLKGKGPATTNPPSRIPRVFCSEDLKGCGTDELLFWQKAQEMLDRGTADLAEHPGNAGASSCMPLWPPSRGHAGAPQR